MSLPIHRRLGFQLALVAAVASALGLAAVSTVLVRQERETLTQQLTLRTLSETRNLALAASAPLLRHDPELGLHPLILRALEEVADLEDLVVADSHGNIVGHSNLLLVGEPLPVPTGEPVSLERSRPGERAIQIEDRIVLRVPVAHLEERVGELVATISRRGIDEAVRSAMIKAVAVSAAGVVAVALLIIVLVTRALGPLAELRASVQRIGSGDLETRTEVTARNELGMLAGLIDDMAGGLSRAQSELIHKERMDHELQIAHDLQVMLLPKKIPTPRGYSLAAHYEPALEVSGDYYDVIPLDAGRMVIILGDVSGKGVPGLVVMAMLRTVARQLALAGADPKQLLVAAHDVLRPNIPRGMFVTCLCGILDMGEHSFHYANAGHCPPVVFGADTPPQFLPVGGKALGMFPSSVLHASLERRTISLQPTQGLLIYSDGLTEAMNQQREQLGEQPVLGALLQPESSDARDILDGLRERVVVHQDGAAAADDLTLFAFVRRPSPAPIEGTISTATSTSRRGVPV
jgi:HAMP domain-containing protein